MRHHPLQPIRALIFASAFLLVVGQGNLATYAEPPSWNGSPVLGVVRLAPLDRLQQDFAFLADGVGGREAATAILDALSDLSDGIDPRRPSGAVVYFDETYVPMIFVPLKDQQRLIAVLASRFGWEFRREGDGCYRYKDAHSDLDVVARAAGSWMYITGASNRDRLQTVPADPMVLFERTDPTLTSYAAFHFAQFPAELRSEIIGKIGEATSGSDADSLAREGTVAAEQLVQRLFAETQSLQFELQCFRPLKQFHLAARLDAVEGSWLARWIENASRRKTLFSHLPSRDSIFAFLASVKLDPDVSRQLTQAWQPLAAAAKASMPSPRSRDHAESLLGRFVEQAVDAVTATIRPGELDGGFVVERQGRDQVVLLAGTTLLGARSVEQAATEVAQLLQQSEEFRAMQWRRTVDGEVGIHQVNIPSTDESAQTLLGDPAVLAIGAGNDRVYAAIGGNETSARLSEALERSREDAPDSGEVIRIHARMAPLLSILAAVPGSNAENDAELEKLAAQIAPYRKNDALELSLKAVDRTLEGRLQIDMGIVQMLAVNVPVAGAPSMPQAAGQGAGVLRLQAGDRFQLEFHTKSDVTTKIDGNDRRDRGVHSLTYDFRVDKVAADGTMRIATSLSRATLDKTSPDGRELFDSVNPPETEAMTAEMFLLGALVGETFTIAVRSDGTIAEISGLAEAIENVLDAKLQPSGDERERARAFVAQILNEDQLRDSLTRGFEFYPGKEIPDGAGWTRTTENLALMKFSLDNRYQTETISPDEVVISVRSQVRQPDADDGQDQPIRWKVAGSQSGTIRLDRRSGRLRLAKYSLRLDAEARFELEGAMVSRPMVSAIEMAIGEPSLVAAEVSRDVSARPEDSPDRSGSARETAGSTLPPGGASTIAPGSLEDVQQPRFGRDSVAGKTFRMFWHQDGHRGVVANVTLQAEGRVDGAPSDQEAFWQIDRSGNLVLYGRNRRIATTFDQQTFRGGRWFLSGTYHVARGVGRSLEEAPSLPKVLDDETLNRIIRPWSKQRIVSLNPNESYRFQLADGTARIVRVEQVQEHRDSVLGLVRQARVRVRIDGQPVDLLCAPYVMPTEIAGLRIQADITSGMEPELPKQVSLSLWDANDPIVDTEAFVFPLRDYRLFSHDLHAYNEVVWLGLDDGDPRGVTARHSYGIDIAGFEDGETVLAVADGIVLDLFPNTKDPYAALIESSNGVVWEYGHMHSVLPEIREGVAVRRGQPIGVLGKRGGAGNFAHLHLGLHPSPAHRTAVIRTQRLNFFPWILTAYRAKHPQALFALAGAHRVIRVGETCSFDAARSLTFDSKIVSFRWRFHDGETVDRPQAEKTYQQPGTYVAELWIEDEQGGRDVDFCRVKVFPQNASVRGIPTIFMTHTPTVDIRAGQPVRFRGWLQAEKDAPLLLDFGDGTGQQRCASYAELTHAFDKPGIYVVTASATVDGIPIMHKQKVFVTEEGIRPALTVERGSDGDAQVASFTAEQIRTWRVQLGRWAMMPESAPEGWSKSRNDPAKLLTLFPKLKVRQGYVLRAYQFREEGNGNGFVWALPVDAEFPEPDESPRLQGHFLNPPKPFDALDDLMEAIEGDDSPESYLHASILRRQWSEFGAGWHGIDWGTHTVLDDSPWKGGPPRDDDDPGERPTSRPSEWKWGVAQPDDWKPQVRLEPNRAIVTFYTYTALAKDGPDGEMERERVVRHTDTYRRGKYRALVTEKKIAEGPDALAF
jgi:murein DD-endopeptidase MepM/ murein hydrolase activator NlpD